MDDDRCPPAQEIKEEIPDMAEPVFYIVSEYVKEPHISGKVEKPSVEKHEREKRNDLLGNAQGGGDIRDCIAGGGKTIG
jgi:hypothetical protein